jgi:hypothetical protein
MTLPPPTYRDTRDWELWVRYDSRRDATVLQFRIRNTQGHTRDYTLVVYWKMIDDVSVDNVWDVLLTKAFAVVDRMVHSRRPSPSLRE